MTSNTDQDDADAHFVETLEATIARQEKEIAALKAARDKERRFSYCKIGVCLECETELLRNEGPFSSCKCGTGEDTTPPKLIEGLRMEIATLKATAAGKDSQP